MSEYQRKCLTKAQIADLVDELYHAQGKLDNTKALVRSQEDEVKSIQEKLVRYTEQVVGDSEGLELNSPDHKVVVGPKAVKVTGVDADKVLDVLGLENYKKVTSVSVTSLRKYCTPEQFSEVADESHSGARRLTVKF